MKLAKKIIALGVVIIMALGIFSGCGNGANKYGAVMYSNPKPWDGEEFIINEEIMKNRPLNETYIQNEDGEWEYLNDSNLPSSYYSRIETEEDFNRIFKKFPTEVDFEKKTVVLYIFRDLYPGRAYNIKSVRCVDGNLEIKFKIEKARKGVGDAAMPQPRCVVVVLDKGDFPAIILEKL